MSQQTRTAWLFLAPMICVLLCVALWPLWRTFSFAFTDANLSNITDYSWIGFENFYSEFDGEQYGVLVDPDWWRSVRNTLVFTLISVSMETILGLIVALVLHQKFFGRGVVRAAVLVPWAIPTIVSAKIWAWMLHDQFGLINDALLSLGLIAQPIAWTVDIDLSLFVVVCVDVWKTTPFMALLILAALQMLPTDCYQAAKIDGIPPWRVFLKITLPMIWPALMVAVIFRALDALRVFDLIYVLTPNSRETMSMSVYARQNLVDFQEIGYGSAASSLLFMIIAFCIALYMTAAKVKLTDDGGGR